MTSPKDQAAAASQSPERCGRTPHICGQSRMIIRQNPRPGAWCRVAATQLRARQTLQIAGEWSPPGSPSPVRKWLELSARFLWPPPPANVRDGLHGPSTESWFSRQVVEWLMSPCRQCYHCSHGRKASPGMIVIRLAARRVRQFYEASSSSAAGRFRIKGRRDINQPSTHAPKK